MARKIVVTSGKGGVGKTTISANLGNFLALQGFKVVIIDLDIGLNNLDVALGVENRVVYDIFDILNNRCRARQALIQDNQNPYLYILPSTHSNIRLTKSEINKVLGELNDFFDFIILDCPAGIDEGFHRAVAVADEAIVVVTPHISSIRDADKVCSLLASYGISCINCVVNRVRGDLIMSREILAIEDIYDLLNIKIIGVIPEDDAISILSNCGSSFKKQCKSYRAYYLLAENVIDGTNKIFDCTLEYRGFVGMVKRKLKRSV